jgi:hypothetical protein
LNVPQTRDLTKNSFAPNRITDNLRPVPGAAYPAGTVLQLVPQDSQAYIDTLTVQPVAPAQRAPMLIGAVPAEWAGGGFDGLGNPTAAASGARGTQMVEAVIYGAAHVLIDQSGANAATLTNGIPVTSSEVTTGYGEGTAAATAYANAILGYASLPAAGFGSSLTAAALAQATVTFTIAAPAAGDTIGVTIQVPYIQDSPGVAQTRTVSVVLTAATAATATTAALALLTAINADPVLGKMMVATQVAGVITCTILGTYIFAVYPASQWVNAAIPFNVKPLVYTLTGMLANTITTVAVASGGGGTTNVASATTFLNGTGYKGFVSVFLKPAVGL